MCAHMWVHAGTHTRTHTHTHTPSIDSCGHHQNLFLSFKSPSVLADDLDSYFPDNLKVIR